MIRPFTCLCLLAAAGSGLYLYQTKHRAQLLDRDIATTLRQTDQVRDRIRILGAEWALLNEPDRLSELARQHLALKALAPTQFVALADLPAHLPAPLPRGTLTIPPDDEPAAPVPAAAPAAPAVPVPVAAARPATPPRAVVANDRPGDKPKPALLAAAAPPLPPAPPLAPPPAQVAPPAQLVAQAATTSPAPAAAPGRAPSTTLAAAAPRPAAPPVSAPPAPAVPTIPAAGRILAPVVAVSAGAIQPTALAGTNHPLAPGTVGEAVARSRARTSPAMPTLQPSANTPYAATPYSSAPYASAPYSSALGGPGQTHLPAPVPYTGG